MNSTDRGRAAKFWVSVMTQFFKLPAAWTKSGFGRLSASDDDSKLDPEDALPVGARVKCMYGVGTVVSFRPENSIYTVKMRWGGNAFVRHSDVVADGPPPAAGGSSSSSSSGAAKGKASKGAGAGAGAGNSEVFYGNATAYVVFRLYHILYDRLLSIKRLCSKAQRQRRVAHPVERAGASASSAPSGDRGEEDYRTFLGMLTALLDGTLDNSKFEDECRNLVGTSSYFIFTAEKLLSQLVKQLSHLVSHDKSAEALQALQAFSADRTDEAAKAVHDAYSMALLGELDSCYKLESKSGLLELTLIDGMPAPTVAPMHVVEEEGESVSQWDGESPVEDMATVTMAMPLFKSRGAGSSSGGGEGEDDGAQQRFRSWLEEAVGKISAASSSKMETD